MKTPSDFKAITTQEISKLSHQFKTYPWENKEAYVDFISNMYYFLSQACRLLTSSASHCGLEYDHFHHRFVEHAHEEKNHEKLVLHDLKVLKAELQPVFPSIKPLWQTQFYMIEHLSPLSLFGCILYLENMSLHPDVGPQVYERCLAKYGPKATTYLRVHVEEDANHVDSLFEFIGKLPAQEIPHVEDSLRVTSSIFKSFFSELYEKHAVAKDKAA